MKKITTMISVLLIAALVLGAFSACGFRLPKIGTITMTDAAESAQTEPATEVTEVPETREVRWSYTLRIETTEDTYYGDDDELYATVSCERPVLELVSDGDADSIPPAAMQAVCDSFNRNFDEIYADLSAETQGKSAEETYREIGFRYAYENEIKVIASRVDGDLVEIELQQYIYCGGAHGGCARVGWHFDLQEGEFFTLSDLTDDDAGLSRAVSDEILRQIDATGAGAYYFDGYEETIRNKEQQEFTLGENAMTVIFGEYEIASYADGIQEFEVSYDTIRGYLNARGERLLFGGSD